jgi:hypothetical protein
MSAVALNREQFSDQFADPHHQFSAQPPPPPAAGTFRQARPRGPNIDVPSPRFDSAAADGQNLLLATYLRPNAGHPGGPDQGNGGIQTPTDVFRTAGQYMGETLEADPFAEPLSRTDVGSALGDIAGLMDF